MEPSEFGYGDLYAGVPYEYAAVASPAGLLFTAGACPLDADGAVVALDDIGTQAGAAVDNLIAVLRTHGSDASDIVQTRIYVVGDRLDLVQVWDVIAARLDPHRPPSTLLGVTVLGYPDRSSRSRQSPRSTSDRRRQIGEMGAGQPPTAAQIARTDRRSSGRRSGTVCWLQRPHDRGCIWARPSPGRGLESKRPPGHGPGTWSQMIGGVHVAGPLCGQSPSCRGGELLRQSGRYRASRLLLHGFPETHACWHRIAPRLAESHRVVAPDLRGYGASEAPPGGPLGERYTKREMAAELVALMSDLGHERFAVVGHDRGGRVGYRLALDHPGRVTRAALLNIVPTLDQFERMAAHPSLGYWTWFLLAQPAPFPEKLVLAEPRALLDHVFATWARDPEAIAPAQREAYLRALTPSTAAAMCADFRASFHLDRQHERDDRATGRRIASPVLVVTGQDEAQLADAPRRVGGMDRRPHGAARRRRPLQPRGSARPGHRPPCGLPREPPTRMTGGRAMQRPRGAARSRCRGQPPATKATTT